MLHLFLFLLLRLIKARFINDIIPIVPLVGRGKNKLPKWMKKHVRPNHPSQAQNCIPPGISKRIKGIVFHHSKDRPILLYNSIQDAILMESAFWLERQFCQAQGGTKTHWYQHDLGQMMKVLKRHSET